MNPRWRWRCRTHLCRCVGARLSHTHMCVLVLHRFVSGYTARTHTHSRNTHTRYTHTYHAATDYSPLCARLAPVATVQRRRWRRWRRVANSEHSRRTHRSCVASKRCIFRRAKHSLHLTTVLLLEYNTSSLTHFTVLCVAVF